VSSRRETIRQAYGRRGVFPPEALSLTKITVSRCRLAT